MKGEAALAEIRSHFALADSVSAALQTPAIDRRWLRGFRYNSTSMPTPARIVVILDLLRNYLAGALSDRALSLDTPNQDGRVNSQENERQISHALRLFTHSNEWFRLEGLSIEVADPRFWHDFCVRGPGDLFIPVNVKVSTFLSADNLSSKEGLFFSLTGVDPRSVRINSWEQFCDQLAANLGRNRDADYYFLAVSKVDAGDVFWTALKCLQRLRPNGSNPPYQCKWSENRERVERPFDEAASFVLAALRESFVLGANPLLSFDRHLRRYAP